MSALNPILPNLVEEALRIANQTCSKRGYSVVVTNEKIEPKKPVFLQLQYPDKPALNIGITHLVHLRGSDWDNKPFEEIARTTDQVAQAILSRVGLFFSAKESGLYIEENGTIFDFHDIQVTIHEDKTFAIGDTLVTYGGTPLSLTRLKSEGIVEFRKRDGGETELIDQIDKREGKGMFINGNGELYRA